MALRQPLAWTLRIGAPSPMQFIVFVYQIRTEDAVPTDDDLPPLPGIGMDQAHDVLAAAAQSRAEVS
jgi:hypothetical protein